MIREEKTVSESELEAHTNIGAYLHNGLCFTDGDRPGSENARPARGDCSRYEQSDSSGEKPKNNSNHRYNIDDEVARANMKYCDNYVGWADSGCADSYVADLMRDGSWAQNIYLYYQENWVMLYLEKI